MHWQDHDLGQGTGGAGELYRAGAKSRNMSASNEIKPKGGRSVAIRANVTFDTIDKPEQGNERIPRIPV
jgi:hypothetical protein